MMGSLQRANFKKEKCVRPGISSVERIRRYRFSYLKAEPEDGGQFSPRNVVGFTA